MGADGLHYPERKTNFKKLMMILHKVLAIAEIEAPPGAQGAFIPVGNVSDAFAALAKILGSAKLDVFIVDPYMDATEVMDFAGSAPEAIPVRLLTDEATAKPDLGPAAQKWNQQYPTRARTRVAQPKRLFGV